MTRYLAALAGAMLAASAAPAADFSFTGTLARDNDKAAFAFTLTQAATVTLTSLGYAGGANAAGATIARGGFDPVLSLYGASGDAIDFGDDGPGTPTDPVTGVAADPFLSEALAAGSYVVYLTQYSNFGPLVVPGAFPFDGEPDFRGGFVDFYGSQRTGAYALDIRNVATATRLATAAVPEPAVWAMLLIGFGGIGGAMRHRRGATAVRFG